MSSKTYFTIAGVLLVTFLLLYFVEAFGVSVWIRRGVVVLFAAFTFLGQREKKEEEEQQKRR